MKTETIVMCVVLFLLGMLLFHMLKGVCGCKVVEGQEGKCYPLNTDSKVTNDMTDCYSDELIEECGALKYSNQCAMDHKCYWMDMYELDSQSQQEQIRDEYTNTANEFHLLTCSYLNNSMARDCSGHYSDYGPCHIPQGESDSECKQMRSFTVDVPQRGDGRSCTSTTPQYRHCTQDIYNQYGTAIPITGGRTCDGAYKPRTFSCQRELNSRSSFFSDDLCSEYADTQETSHGGVNKLRKFNPYGTCTHSSCTHEECCREPTPAEAEAEAEAAAVASEPEPEPEPSEDPTPPSPGLYQDQPQDLGCGDYKYCFGGTQDIISKATSLGIDSSRLNMLDCIFRDIPNNDWQTVNLAIENTPFSRENPLPPNCCDDEAFLICPNSINEMVNAHSGAN